MISKEVKASGSHLKKLKNIGQKTGLKSVPQTGNLVSRSILMS